jgi:CRISPR-associated protein Csb2
VFHPGLEGFRLACEPGSPRRLPLNAVRAVVERWREALLARSNDLASSVRSLLAGHDAAGRPLEQPHVAFLPLASLDPRRTEAFLAGLALVLPRAAPVEDARGVLQAAARVERLLLGRLGVWRLVPVRQPDAATDLHPARWTAHPAGAVAWATVTPVAFDRHPKAKDRGAYQREVGEMIGVAGDGGVVAPGAPHAPPAEAQRGDLHVGHSQRGANHGRAISDA